MRVSWDQVSDLLKKNGAVLRCSREPWLFLVAVMSHRHARVLFSSVLVLDFQEFAVNFCSFSFW